MATTWTPLAVLAKQLGVRLNDVMRACADLRIPANRGASKLSPAQVDRVRKHFEAKASAARRELQAARERAERAAKAVADQQTVADEVSTKPKLTSAGMPSEVPNGCVCCGLRLVPTVVTLAEEPRCPNCREHFQIQGEDLARTLARLRDHDLRLRRAYVATWHAQDDANDKARGARRSRDGWKAVTAKLVLKHEPNDDGDCQSCGKLFPCSTWGLVESVNIGIARQLEYLGTLDDAEVDERLYGSDWWEYIERATTAVEGWGETPLERPTGTGCP